MFVIMSYVKHVASVIHSVVRKNSMSELKTIRVGLVSGGRESTAMVRKAELLYGENFFQKKIFADTGDDPEGLSTVEYLNKNKGWNVQIVKSKYGNIRKYYEDKIVDNEPEFIGHAMQSQANKDCSLKFKIIPISTELRAEFGDDVFFELFFGFSFSKKEVHRLKATKERLEKTKIKQTARSILIENHLTRKDSGEICMEYLGFIPERSLCDMCFERTKQDWKDFNKKHPERFMSVVEFDESSKLYKKYGYGLSSGSLRKIVRLRDESQTTLDVKPCPCIQDFAILDEQECATVV